jgi:hypothetical protein
MLASNARIKLLLALLAVVFFSGILVISVITIQTPRQQSAAAYEPEAAPPRGEKKFEAPRGARPVHHPTTRTQPGGGPSTTGSSAGNSEQSELNTVSVIGTIVSSIGTILSVLITWLTYRQGKKA